MGKKKNRIKTKLNVMGHIQNLCQNVKVRIHKTLKDFKKKRKEQNGVQVPRGTESTYTQSKVVLINTWQ